MRVMQMMDAGFAIGNRDISGRDARIARPVVTHATRIDPAGIIPHPENPGMMGMAQNDCPPPSPLCHGPIAPKCVKLHHCSNQLIPSIKMFQEVGNPIVGKIESLRQLLEKTNCPGV